MPNDTGSARVAATLPSSQNPTERLTPEDLSVPDLSHVDEVLEGLEEGERFDHEVALDLPPAAQAQLVLAYQRARRVQRVLEAGSVPADQVAQARRLCESADVVTGLLLRSVLKVVRSEVWKQSKARLGAQWAKEVQAELRSTATATVLEAASSYDPSRGSAFSSWVVEGLKADLPKALVQHGRGASLPPSWERTIRIARNVGPELEEALGRKPTDVEFHDAMENRAMAWAREHLTPEQAALSAEEQYALMEEKLVKQGMRAALKELSKIRQYMQAEVNLDAPVGSTDGTTLLRDLVGGGEAAETAVLEDADLAEYTQSLGAGLGNLSEAERRMVLACLGVPEGERRTYRSVAQEHGVADLVVRRLVRTVEARLQAPHAQYAYLGTPLHEQFEPEVEDDEPAEPSIGALRRRRRATISDDDLMAAFEVAGVS